MDIQSVNVNQIKPGDNDRQTFNWPALKALAESIHTHGLAQPITVRPIADGYEIVAGERRFRACKLLGWDQIPAIVRNLDDEEAAAIMLAENVHRVDLNPMDEAHAYDRRMQEFGWSPSQVAKNANVSPRRVQARLALLELVPEAQTLIASGQLSPGYGEAMAPLDHNRQRIAMRYFETTEKPLLREFKAVTGKLFEEQAQGSLFDMSTLVIEVAVQTHNQKREKRQQRRFPTDDSLPLMKKSGTVGLSLETYIAQLLKSSDPHHRQAAAIVGRMYQAMLSTGMAFPPRPERESPLDDPNLTW